MFIERAANAPSRKDLDTERDVLNQDGVPSPSRRFVRTTANARISPAAIAAAVRELRAHRHDRRPPA
jgi:hypothetical protein